MRKIITELTFEKYFDKVSKIVQEKYVCDILPHFIELFLERALFFYLHSIKFTAMKKQVVCT